MLKSLNIRESMYELIKLNKKIAVHLPENLSVFINQSSVLSQIFGCDLVQNQTGFIMKGICPDYPQ